MEQIKKREGFHLKCEVSSYLKQPENNESFSLAIFLITCLCLIPWAARVCECMLLVCTAQHEGEGRKCRLLGETGKSEFVFLVSGLKTPLWKNVKTPRFKLTFLCGLNALIKILEATMFKYLPLMYSPPFESKSLFF